jgi:spore maturation protein SpmA
MFKNLLKKITFLLISAMFLSLLHAETIQAGQEGNRSTESNKTDIFVDNIVSHWTGDLDGMLKDRLIRVLVIPSMIMYKVDKGKRSGIFYELMMKFEKSINEHY